MKSLFIFLALILLSGCATKTTNPWRDEIINKTCLGGQIFIEGRDVGDGPDPGNFYILSLEISEKGSEKQFRSMLVDPHPSVRCMGIICLAKNEYEFDPLIGDQEEVGVYEFGCVGMGSTVENFSYQIKTNMHFRSYFIDGIEK